MEQRTIDPVKDALVAQSYIPTDQIATVLYLADKLEKPLLTEGPAGVGKTELAKAWAAATGRELIRLQCYEGLDETKALYEWEYAKQMLYTQLLRDKLNNLLADAESLRAAADRLAGEEEVFFSQRFLLQRPLLRAILNPNPTLLLIDEIDRCVVEGTMVMTTTGPVAVETLRCGDQLVGFDPETFKRTTVTLQKIHSQPTTRLLRILVGGRLLLVTPEHRFVRFDEEGNSEVVQADTLQVGDYLPIDRNVTAADSSFVLPSFNDEITKISSEGKSLLNQRIREVGLTQRAAALAVGISHNHLRNVIMPSGQRDSLRAGVLEKLCEETDEQFDEFCTKHTFGLRPRRCLELFEVLGYATGDGCYTNGRFTIADKDPNLLSIYADKFKDAFSVSPSINPGPHRNFELEYHSLPFGRWILPLMGPAFNRSRDRQLPLWIWSLDGPEQLAFLRGLFDAEGWVGDHDVAFASASWKMIVGVQLLLAYHDIEGRISIKKPSEKNFSSYISYELHITDIDAFTAKIHFNSAAKRQKIAKIQPPRFHKGDILPARLVRPELERIRQERILHTIPKHQALYDLLGGRIKMNRSTIGALADVLEHERLQDLVNHKLSLGQITSIETVEEAAQVYDLTVSGPAYFVANGVVTHNCDPEFEAFLLEVLSDFQITVPELGTLRAVHKPIVILTSNNTRELSEALKRRCMYLFIGYPSIEEELRVVQLKVPQLAPKLARQAVEFVQRLRGLDLKKSPSISETLDWARALVLLNAKQIDQDTLDQTMTVLLKHESDLQRTQRALQTGRNRNDDVPPRRMR